MSKYEGPDFTPVTSHNTGKTRLAPGKPKQLEAKDLPLSRQLPERTKTQEALDREAVRGLIEDARDTLARLSESGVSFDTNGRPEMLFDGHGLGDGILELGIYIGEGNPRQISEQGLEEFHEQVGEIYGIALPAPEDFQFEESAWAQAENSKQQDISISANWYGRGSLGYDIRVMRTYSDRFNMHLESERMLVAPVGYWPKLPVELTPEQAKLQAQREANEAEWQEQADAHNNGRPVVKKLLGLDKADKEDLMREWAEEDDRDISVARSGYDDVRREGYDD